MADPVVILPLSLGTLWVSDYIILMLLVWAVAVFVNLWWHLRWRVVLLIVFSPFTVFFGHGALEYFLGNAAIRYMGLPTVGSGNLDPVYRCEKVTAGCVARGGEWVRNAPYNFAATLLIRTLGPQKGSYIGPYPSQREAEGVLKVAVPVDYNSLIRDRIQMGQRTVTLCEGVGAGLLTHSSWGYFGEYPAELADLEKRLGPITAGLYRESVLVLRVPEEGYSHSTPAVPSAMLVLIDTNTGRPFAYYAQGDYYHISPPVRWRK